MTEPFGYASALGIERSADAGPDAVLAVGVVSSAPAPGGGVRSRHATTATPRTAMERRIPDGLLYHPVVAVDSRAEQGGCASERTQCSRDAALHGATELGADRRRAPIHEHPHEPSVDSDEPPPLDERAERAIDRFLERPRCSELALVRELRGEPNELAFGSRQEMHRRATAADSSLRSRVEYE